MWSMKVTNAVGALGKLFEVLERILINRKKNRYHPGHSIIKISESTEKSPVDPIRFAVTRTSVKASQFTQMYKKTRKERNNSNNNNNNNLKQQK